MRLLWLKTGWGRRGGIRESNFGWVFLTVDFILQGFTVAEVGGFRSIKYSICTGKSGTDVGFSGLKRCQRCDESIPFSHKTAAILSKSMAIFV